MQSSLKHSAEQAGKQILNRYPALGFAAYRRYWFASFASVGATQLIALGQGWLIFELTSSALYLGLLGAAASVPNIVMTLFGGNWVISSHLQTSVQSHPCLANIAPI